MKLCTHCKHYYFESEYNGFREKPPKERYKEGCGKDYWRTDIHNWTKNDRDKAIIRAFDCKDYKFHKDTK